MIDAAAYLEQWREGHRKQFAAHTQDAGPTEETDLGSDEPLPDKQ
jgi:hypothetical protein